MNQHGLGVNGTRLQKISAAGLLAFSICFLSPLAFGQTVAAPQEETGAKSNAAPLSLNVEEVSIDLVVHDRQHRSILDLHPGDIAITDNGTPVKLKNLHLVSAESAKGHLITLVFDPMKDAAAHNAGEIASKIVAMLPKNGFNVAVLMLGSRLRMVQGFTGDSKAQSDAIRLVTEDSPAQQNTAIAEAEKNLTSAAQTGVDAAGRLVSARDRTLDQVLLAAMEGSQRIVQEEQALPSLAGLLALSRAQQQLEERKTVIYFARNGQLDQDANAMVKTVMGAAGRANVSIYTIDMTGVGAGVRDQLMTMMAIAPTAGINPTAPTVSPMASSGPVTALQALTMPKVQTSDPAGPGAGSMIASMTQGMEAQGIGNGVANSSPLGALCSLSGGAYIDGQTSTKKPLEQMLQDMTTYYQATYIPPEQEFDGSFRPIAVKSLRSGLIVQAKAGYFALASGGADGIRPFEAPLMKILSDPQLPAAQNFHAAVLRMGNRVDGNTNSVVVEVPLSTLEMREDKANQLYSAHVSIVAQIKDRNGMVIDHFAEDVPRNGPIDAIEEARSEFVTLQRHFIAIPGDYLLEVAVLDRNSGQAGAQRIPFKIPQPPAGPALSDVALVRKLAAVDPDADPREPMLYETGKVIPNLSGQVNLDGRPVSLFFVVHPDPKAKEPPQLEMDILHDGALAGHAPLAYRPGADEIPFLAVLRAGTLSPGFYDVVARMTQGGKKAETSLSFTVLDNRPAAAVPAAGDAPAKPAAETRNDGQLVFTVPAAPVPAPSWQEYDAILADAGKSALAYGDSLPGFQCVEETDRSVAPDTISPWKHKESLTESLRYRDKSEIRTLLQVDGEPAPTNSDQLKGAAAAGALGGVLTTVFQPSSKADFKWKEARTLGAATIQVFTYRVTAEHSDFILAGAKNDRTTPAFHGQVFIDAATHAVRRVTLIADNLPADFSLRSSTLTVDYANVTIASRDYLLPIAGEVHTIHSDHSAAMTQFAFRDYKSLDSGAIPLEANPQKKP
jgi:VWFA-related protein